MPLNMELHALALKPHSFTDHVMGNVTYIHEGMVECLLYRWSCGLNKIMYNAWHIMSTQEHCDYHGNYNNTLYNFILQYLVQRPTMKQ